MDPQTRSPFLKRFAPGADGFDGARPDRGPATVGGETVTATRAVIASVTPTQLYGKLLGPGMAPLEAAQAAEAFRYGRAGMQIHSR